jgi:hypothetical protein
MDRCKIEEAARQLRIGAHVIMSLGVMSLGAGHALKELAAEMQAAGLDLEAMLNETTDASGASRSAVTR